MLARQVDALRVNVKGLAASGIPPYLESMGWRRATRRLKALLADLNALVDQLTLCVDVGTAILPRIGLECFLAGQPQHNPRWQDWFDYLVARGWCTPAKREALLRWPGITTPFNATESWPSDLLIESLSRDAEDFRVFNRRIMHVKIAYEPGRRPRAKAYLWFNHRPLDRAAKAELPIAADDPRAINGPDAGPYRARVRDYYDATTQTYLEHLGTTLQADLIAQSPTSPDPATSNLWLAERAGLCADQRVLDAGCGVAGPAVDIARAYSTVRIDAITISPRQAEIGQERVRAAGLGERVRLYLGDYHALPFVDESFDAVVFFESSGYSDDRTQLFAEVRRVLRPGG